MITNISLIVIDGRPQTQIDFQGIGSPTALDQKLIGAVEGYVSAHERVYGVEAVADLVREFHAARTFGVEFGAEVTSPDSGSLMADLADALDHLSEGE